MPFRPFHLPREKTKKDGRGQLLNPASCPPALMVLGQVKANSEMRQTSRAPILTLGWQPHTCSALVSAQLLSFSFTHRKLWEPSPTVVNGQRVHVGSTKISERQVCTLLVKPISYWLLGLSFPIFLVGT